MAFNLGDIFVTFKAKTDDLKAGVDQVKRYTDQAEKTVNGTSFKAFSQQASSSFGTVANAIQGVITKAAIFATTSSVGIGAFVKSAADLQQTSKSFEVLTGNVDTANKLFAQLAKYASTTPFEFPDIAKAGQILLGFGIESDKVFGRIQMLGDIAAATGADFQSLALVFGQVNATGRLMGQDALQLINNKIPITSILAKDLGLTVQEVKQRMEEGAISTEQFNASLEKVTKEGGFAFHGTDVLAQSLNGRLSTLKDTTLEFGRNLIGVKVDPELGLVVKPGGIFDRISTAIPKITKSLGDLTPKVTRVFDFIMRNGETIKDILLAVAVAFTAAKVAAIAFSIAASANPIGLVAAAITLLIGALTFLQLKFDIFGKTLQFIKPFWDALVQVFTQFLLPSLNALANTIMSQVMPALSQVWQAVVRLWNALNPALLEALKIVGLIIGGLLVGSLWLLVNVINVAVNVVTFLTHLFADLIGWVANLIQWFGNLVGATINAVGAVLGWFGKIPGAVGNILSQVVGWFKRLPGEIGSALSGITNTLTAPFKAAFNAVSKLWNNSLGKLSFKAPSWVPEFGGKGWSMPTLPYLASGVENFAGGWAVVGENGPELTYLPKGSNVYSNEKSTGMMGKSMVIQGDVNIGSRQDADYLLSRFDRDVQLEAMGLSPQGA